MDSSTSDQQDRSFSSDEHTAPASHPHPQITNPSLYMDTTLTKVFVGGLAWQTKSAVLHEHFAQYGDILEAVVIMDRNTGRSKGFGFVTFADKEAAERATQNPNPVIDNRKANCNLAFLGATKRPAGPGRRDFPPQFAMPAMALHPYGYTYAAPPSSTSPDETRAVSVEGAESSTSNGAVNTSNGVVMMNSTNPYGYSTVAYPGMSSPYQPQTYSPYAVYQGDGYNPVFYGFSPQMGSMYMTSPSSLSSRPSFSPEQMQGPHYFSVYQSPAPAPSYSPESVYHTQGAGTPLYPSGSPTIVNPTAGPPPLILPQTHPNAVQITGVEASTRSDSVINPEASPALSAASSSSSSVSSSSGSSPSNSSNSPDTHAAVHPSDKCLALNGQTPNASNHSNSTTATVSTHPTVNGTVVTPITTTPTVTAPQQLRETSPVSPLAPFGGVTNGSAPLLAPGVGVGVPYLSPHGAYAITTTGTVLMPFPQPGIAHPLTTAHTHPHVAPNFYNHHRSPPHHYANRGVRPGLQSQSQPQHSSAPSHHPRGNGTHLNGASKPLYYNNHYTPQTNPQSQPQPSSQDALAHQFQQLSVTQKAE